MQKLSKLLFVSVIVLTLSATAFAGEYSSAFQQYSADNQSRQMIGAIITMADQVDLRALQDRLYAIHADRLVWHENVVRTLQEKATVSQANILNKLQELQDQGLVERYRGLWLGSVVLVTATREALDLLVVRDDVLRISPDYEIEGIRPVDVRGDDQTITHAEPGLRAINADDVWAMGFTGEGRLVSHLDTGVDGNHNALSARWRGLDPRYSGNPGWAWFDPVTNTDFPFDSGSHGTHTMGTICGLGTGAHDTIGVAFGAQWISAGVIDRVSIPRTVQDALAAFQWIADPDEDPGTVWDVPDVCSNSWGVMTSHGYPPCDETFWVVLEGCEAAGVVVVFAAGNEGPSPNSLRRPADRATTDLTSFSVGAVDGNNPSLPIADFSSRGPSYCTPDGSAAIKPEVVAPGENVWSAMPGGGYQQMSGTSMASPHVGGVVALVRQANPNLTSEQVRQILLDTARDLGTPGEDNTYGKGVVDAYAAVQRALAYLEGWGTLAGTITDQASGSPIFGARISVLNRPWSSTSRQNGTYFIFMPADTAWQIRVEFPPTHLPVLDTVTVPENDTIIIDYALEGKVPVTLRASFANPLNVDYRSFYLKGSWNNDGFYDAGWSGDLIEIKDDGQGPDQTAGDGVFTGQVRLARDPVHTYSWAIYTENYGGEAARLQNGANFQIPNLTPPVVPTLVVNPSGTTNNWIISAVGDHGLNLDLLQGVDNRPTKWGAACSLFVGNTYTFKFRVMHSTIASYGVGGVGGADLSYTPTVTGPYDFIFDDRNDTYVVQLSGTEGPPTYLSAQSGLDHHVPVSWLPPGTVESQELSYDDGVMVNAYYYYAYDNLMATMFEPASYPLAVDSVIIHVLTDGDPYWPWPDPTHDPIGISIFLDDGAGQPQPDPVYYTEVTGAPGEWIRVDMPEDQIVVSEGYFWVAMNNLAGGGEEGLGVDAATDYQANKWSRVGGVWGLESFVPGDHMIRAKVFGGGRSSWMGYDASPSGPIPEKVPMNDGASLASGTTGARVISPNRLSYHPRLSPTDPPVIADEEVLAGYNLYRDTQPGPYDRHLNRINTVYITATRYDDWGNDLVPPGLTNGVTYYYQASAVYDIGGGQYVEVGPSNQVTGTPVNHPPLSPYNLRTNVVGRNVNLIWQFVNAVGDFDHFSIERKLMPYGAWGQIGTTAETTFVNVIGPGEDGTYGYRIVAVDDGTPPLSSRPSNVAYGLVGHLPPSGLRAGSGEEFAVPLHWMLPGSWRAQAGSNSGPLDHASAERGNKAMVRQTVGSDNSLKGQSGPVNPPMTLGRGGPDEFGYTWVDSDEPDGPVFEWRDITPNGEQIPLSGDDSNMGPYDIGFDFPFYGEMFNTFNICTNGWISFTSTSNEYWNTALPDPTSPENLLAAFWDDLAFTGAAEAWFYSDGAELVISFINVPHLGGSGPSTFQIILRSTGTFFYQYQTMGPPLNNCTIGIQNGDGSIGLQVVYNADYLHDSMAIRIGSGPEGFAPVHYKLYRSLISPVPLDPAHLLTSNIVGDQVAYTDRQGIQNGTTYYYVMSAVWPDSVESPGSNEAVGTPQNHPPLAPFNLTSNVIGYDVHLNWSFLNAVGDFNHFSIYKKFMPSGNWVFAGSTPDSSFIMTIPQGEDGVYAVAVTAVDNGTPPLESVHSNEIQVLIGHLPPTNLQAESDHDARVPLSWYLPGGTRAQTAGDGTTPAIKPRQSSSGSSPKLVEDPNLDLSMKGRTEPVNPPVTLGRGGPDEFGYTWVDSDEPDGPTYSWRDIVDRGTQVPISGDDQNMGPFDIGFDFEFYGNVFSTFNMCGNGWVSFTSTNTYYSNQTLPNTSMTPFDLLAPFWDDLYPPRGGQFWYYSDGSECVISYIDVPHIGVGGPYTFQIVIRQSGTILFQYQAMGSPTDQSTIGIQNSDGTVGLQVVYNAAYLHDDMAIRFRTRPEGFAPVHYKLYRSTTTPVPIDPAHLITSAIPGDSTDHIDSVGLQNGTRYYYRLTAVWPDSVESPPSNEAFATPVMGARMVLDPLSFAVQGNVGQIVTRNLNIANPGGLNLDFSIFAQVDRLQVVPDGGQPGQTQKNNPPPVIQPADKSQAPPDVTYPPMLLGRGGPDEFGYIWIDSDEPGGPPVAWADVAGRGQQLFMSDDDNQGPFDLGFDFPFYGNAYSSIRVCSNGFASFTSTSTTYSNQPIPGSFAPLDLLAPFWDDMNPLYGGEIWLYTSTDSAVVSWNNIMHYSSGGPYTYQVVITSGGLISFNYQDIGYPDNSATVGIQNSDGSIGLQIAYNQTYVHSGLSVRITAGWLSVEPSSGTVAPGANTNVSVIFDASFLEPGNYTGMLRVTGVDQNHQVGEVVIPVTFGVQTSIDEPTSNLPKEFGLSQNYPNPFNPTTEIKFALPVRAHVDINIFNVLGQRVRSLVNADMDAGYRSVIWNGTDDAGANVSSGIYFYKLAAGDKAFTKKMMLLK